MTGNDWVDCDYWMTGMTGMTRMIGMTVVDCRLLRIKVERTLRNIRVVL